MINPTKEALEELRDSGLTRKDIANKYQVSLSQVKRWISDLKVIKKTVVKATPTRQKSINKHLPDDAGMTVMERAKRVLGVRLSETSAGYLLDGRIANVHTILRAAAITAKKVD